MPFKDTPILLVDDEAEILELLKESLVDAGFNKVYTCKSAKEALQTFESNRPKLIVSDLLMPGMNGAELYNMVTKKVQKQEVRFVILTGSNIEDVDVKLNEEIEVIKKPLDFSKFPKQITSLCKDLRTNC